MTMHTVRLGVGPAATTAVGAIGVAAAIGGLIALVQNAMADDWADSVVFKNHAQTIHSSMLAIQCLLGGASQGDIVDTYDNTICKAGTPISCVVNNATINEWRQLRDGFQTFWADVGNQWTGPTSAQALRLKQYAQSFLAFYNKLAPVCSAQGAKLPVIDPIGPQKKSEPAPSWLKWTVVGVGLIAVTYTVKLFRG